MDTKAYIASGVLELYVAGQLSEKENREVASYAKEYPEIMAEIVEIENSILALSSAMAPKQVPVFKNVQEKLMDENKGTEPIRLHKGSSRWTSYLGWAASISLVVGLFYLYNENKALNTNLKIVRKEMLKMEQQIADTKNSLKASKELLTTLRDKNIVVVPLGGQDISPNSYAKAYWNKEQNQLFIDAQGLPEPPDGMAYQVWSLTLDPLTPTNVGLLEDFEDDENKVFALANPNESQAFGITLEPAGGSEFPTLQQLYVLGTVSPS